MDSSNALDPNALWVKDEALRRLGGNEVLLNKIVELFLNQIDEKLNEFSMALKSMDADQVAFVSHAIKGIAADVGANALRFKASEFEQLAKLGVLEEIIQQKQNFESIIRQTIEAMTN